jgi:hypothetical protein
LVSRGEVVEVFPSEPLMSASGRWSRAHTQEEFGVLPEERNPGSVWAQ